jgi:hypothetical protein
MAIIASGLTMIAQGVVNLADSSLKMTFWKTNFNMPVPNLYGNLSTWTRFIGPFSYSGQAGSYDLSGFVPGFEVLLATAIWDFENTAASPAGYSANLYSRWCDTDGTTTIEQGYNGQAVSGTLAANSWTEYAYSMNIGVDADEFKTSGTYYHRVKATGTNAFAETSDGHAINNCPDVATLTLSSSKRGYIWVEGNNLAYVNGGSDSGGGWKHSMAGDLVGASGSDAGYLWVGTDNLIHWVGADGNHYKAKWAIKQVYSYFTNGPTGSVNAGTNKAGKIWVDTEFGTTHLGYIGYDGWKYLAGAGDYPYA